MDSLDLVEFIMDFEREFALDVPDEEGEALHRGGGPDVAPARALRGAADRHAGGRRAVGRAAVRRSPAAPTGRPLTRGGPPTRTGERRGPGEPRLCDLHLRLHRAA